MSTHTMPPMSLMCEEFVKSMVKPVANGKVNKNSTDDDTNGDINDALTTRLNGDSVTNGFGSSNHSDDDDGDDADGDVKMTNGNAKSPATNANNLRKNLLRKTEELKRKQKSKGGTRDDSLLLPANDDLESKLRYVAKQMVAIEF